MDAWGKGDSGTKRRSIVDVSIKRQSRGAFKCPLSVNQIEVAGGEGGGSVNTVGTPSPFLG